MVRGDIFDVKKHDKLPIKDLKQKARYIRIHIYGGSGMEMEPGREKGTMWNFWPLEMSLLVDVLMGDDGFKSLVLTLPLKSDEIDLF